MPATLRQHDPNATTPDGHIVEHIDCADGSCDTRYAMSYSPDAADTDENVLETMALQSRRARRQHPHPARLSQLRLVLASKRLGRRRKRPHRRRPLANVG